MKSMRLAQRLWCRPPSAARKTVATGGIVLRLVAGAILGVVVVITTAIAVLLNRAQPSPVLACQCRQSTSQHRPTPPANSVTTTEAYAPNWLHVIISSASSAAGL